MITTRPKDWTVLIWSASDTNLYPHMQKDLERARAAGDRYDVNVVSQTDHAPQGRGGLRSGPGFQEELGSTNMADSDRLAEFVQWGMENYPAEHYVLVVAGHGDGPYGFCRDDSHDAWMTPQQLQNGLEKARASTGQKLDVLAFDACLMGNLETLHQLKDEARFLVGSEEIADAAGWDYNQALKPQASARDFATNLVSMASQRNHIYPTLAAYDAEAIPRLTASVGDLGQALVESSLSDDQLTSARRSTRHYRQFNDLGDFAQKLMEVAGEDSDLGRAAVSVQRALGQAVIAEEHRSDYAGSRGVNIELEQRQGEAYSELAFARETNWEAAQSRLQGNPPSPYQAMLDAEGLC